MHNRQLKSLYERPILTCTYTYISSEDSNTWNIMQTLMSGTTVKLLFLQCQKVFNFSKLNSYCFREKMIFRRKLLFERDKLNFRMDFCVYSLNFCQKIDQTSSLYLFSDLVAWHTIEPDRFLRFCLY